MHLRDPALSYMRNAREPVPAHAAADAPGRHAEDFLPRCLDLLSAEDVIRRIGLYFDGGAVRPLYRGAVADLRGDSFRPVAPDRSPKSDFGKSSGSDGQFISRAQNRGQKAHAADRWKFRDA